MRAIAFGGSAPSLGSFGVTATALGGACKIAAHLFEVGEADVEWKDYKFQVKGVPAKAVTMKEVAFAAYTNMAQNEPGLEATYYYDPPNMTYPNGAYVAVVDVDRETGEVTVRRFLAVDDCGTIINPLVVEGQIHGGLTEGFACRPLSRRRIGKQPRPSRRARITRSAPRA